MLPLVIVLFALVPGTMVVVGPQLQHLPGSSPIRQIERYLSFMYYKSMQASGDLYAIPETRFGGWLGLGDSPDETGPWQAGTPDFNERRIIRFSYTIPKYSRLFIWFYIFPQLYAVPFFSNLFYHLVMAWLFALLIISLSWIPGILTPTRNCFLTIRYRLSTPTGLNDNAHVPANPPTLFDSYQYAKPPMGFQRNIFLRPRGYIPGYIHVDYSLNGAEQGWWSSYHKIDNIALDYILTLQPYPPSPKTSQA